MEEISRLFPVNIEGMLEVADGEPERTDGQEGGFPHVRMTSDGGIFINGHRMEAVTDMTVKPAFRNDCHTVILEFERLSRQNRRQKPTRSRSTTPLKLSLTPQTAPFSRTRT